MLVLRQNLLLQHFVDLGQLVNIETGIAIGAKQRHHQRLNGRVRGAIGIRRHARIDNVDASFDGFELRHRCHPRSEVAVQVDRCFHRGLQRFDELIHVIGRDHPGHILDAD